MKETELKTGRPPSGNPTGANSSVGVNPALLAKRKVVLTLNGLRLTDSGGKKFKTAKWQGIDAKKTTAFLSQMIDYPLRPGNYPLEILLKLYQKEKSVEKTLHTFYQRHLPFVAQDIVPNLEARNLKVFMVGSAGTGVVSAINDMTSAFSSAGYYGRSFPVFDPSKKGAPVKGYGIVSRHPILSHAPFEVPDIILLFDQKLFPLLRQILGAYKKGDPRDIAILVNTSMDPAEFRIAADFREPYSLHTVSANMLVRPQRIPPNYAMIGGLLGILGEKTVDITAYTRVVRESLTAKFGPGKKVDANLEAFEKARKGVRGEKVSPQLCRALGPVKTPNVPEGQELYFEDGNRAIARSVAMVLNQFPSVVTAYPITPQTQIVEYLSQMIADGTLSAEGVTPESEHGAAGALLGAARDRVLSFTATCSQGFALMSEIVHSIAGMRMGNVVISNVVRSLNSPLDVENDHSDLCKVGLDAGFLVLMSRDVQQAFEFHLISWLVSLYAEYRLVTDNSPRPHAMPAWRGPLKLRGGEGGVMSTRLEMIPDRAVMLPAIVASEGFEVSHAPERYLALTAETAQKLYSDPFFDYVRTFVNTPNRSIMGTLQLSNSRMDTDYQRHLAMKLSTEVLKKVFAKFAEYSGRSHDFLHAYNVEKAKVIFVVAGAANGTFEEVAREFERQGIHVGVVHPNVLRPFPKVEWLKVLKGKRVYVFDRDDPFGAVGGRLYTELAGVVNEYGLAATGTQLYSRIYGLGGRTPTLSLIRDEMVKALKCEEGELQLSPEKEYVGVNL